MLDPKLLRNDIDTVQAALDKRGFSLPTADLDALEKRRKIIQTKTEELQASRNSRSKAIGQAKAAGEDIEPLLKEMQSMGDSLDKAHAELEDIQAKLQDIYYSIPNMPDASVPAGTSEEDNVEVRQWGELPEWQFTPRDHVEVGEGLRQMDFACAAKLSGARFVVLGDGLAHMHRALAQYMLDLHTREHGYREMVVPFLVTPENLYGTGQLPKFAEDQFVTNHEHALTLIPTAEVPLTNFARDMIFEADRFPMRYTAHTPCFRSEAGSYGKDTRGMIRQHQFEKVELVHFAKPAESFATLELLTSHAEAVLQALKLPYRVMLLCGGDMGFSAAKTYDLEVWMPGQNKYREISSCSNCTDFQSRRMKARWRNPETGKPELIHTLNGSGLAIGRTLVAIMENYQDEQGRVRIPDVLKSYMPGVEAVSVS